LAEVKKNNNDKNCWTIVDENVYNLTTWIKSHPGGENAILSLCGVDGTSAFKSKHAGSPGPAGQLDSYKIGKLKD
jgi:cytochrome b involved in lipid metabolism